MTDQGQPMDRLHSVLRTIRTETKSARDYHAVFREFLAHLDQARRKPPVKRAHPKPHPRKRAVKRTK